MSLLSFFASNWFLFAEYASVGGFKFSSTKRCKISIRGTDIVIYRLV
jgi:hypothetical protein